MRKSGDSASEIYFIDPDGKGPMNVHHNAAHAITTLAGSVITHNDCTSMSFRFQDRLFTMTTFFEVAVYLFAINPRSLLAAPTKG